MQSFTDLATAAYCSRKLYYRRKHEDFEPPADVSEIRALAFRYEELLDPETDLTGEPIAGTPTQYRSNLGSAKAGLDRWDELADPPKQDILLEGKDCAALPTNSLRTRRYRYSSPPGNRRSGASGNPTPSARRRPRRHWPGSVKNR